MPETQYLTKLNKLLFNYIIMHYVFERAAVLVWQRCRFKILNYFIKIMFEIIFLIFGLFVGVWCLPPNIVIIIADDLVSNVDDKITLYNARNDPYVIII